MSSAEADSTLVLFASQRSRAGLVDFAATRLNLSFDHANGSNKSFLPSVQQKAKGAAVCLIRPHSIKRRLNGVHV